MTQKDIDKWLKEQFEAQKEKLKILESKFS